VKIYYTSIHLLSKYTIFQFRGLAETNKNGNPKVLRIVEYIGYEGLRDSRKSFHQRIVPLSSRLLVNFHDICLFSNLKSLEL
jgi:hypothetical protein